MDQREILRRDGRCYSGFSLCRRLPCPSSICLWASASGTRRSGPGGGSSTPLSPPRWTARPSRAPLPAKGTGLGCGVPNRAGCVCRWPAGPVDRAWSAADLGLASAGVACYGSAQSRATWARAAALVRNVPVASPTATSSSRPTVEPRWSDMPINTRVDLGTLRPHPPPSGSLR